MTLPIVTVVGGILENEDGQVLLAQRPADKSMPFLWEFPGGKVEPHETPEEALVRELDEEIGIEVNQKDLQPFTFVSLTYPDFHIILLCYLCKTWKGIPIARENQGGINWVSPQDLTKYPMREANQKLIPLLKGRSQLQHSQHNRTAMS